MYSWNERVTCFFSLNNASYIFSILVWLFDANRLVVPSHTFLWEKSDRRHYLEKENRLLVRSMNTYRNSTSL